MIVMDVGTLNVDGLGTEVQNYGTEVPNDGTEV